MSAEIVKLVPESASDDFRLDPDDILDVAKGEKFETVVVLGQMKDGSIAALGNANAGAMLILMEMAKHTIVFGD